MADPQSNFAHCEALVREVDPDRFWANQLAPAEKRPYLHALHAFNFEIARVRESVREPMLGEIRLQWWRDALQGEARGDVRANPVAAALDDAIVKFRLPRQSLVDLIDARMFDLYDDPMPSLNDLEGYCGETSSSLMQLSSIVLADGKDPGTADAAGHAGVAYAITGLLRAFPIHARQGQLYIPVDVLARHGVVREDIVTGRGGPGLKGALADMRAITRRHLDQVKTLRPTIPSAAEPAFRALALVEPYLKAMEKRDYDALHTPVDLPQWRRIWALWRGPF
jgi:15-cis-phytoene synthase